jgi:hypothetical protein
MKHFLFVASAMIAVFAPAVAYPQTTSAPSYGVGPNGYDWLVGTWSCTNSMPPTPDGGPVHTTLTVSKTNGGDIFLRTTGTNFDVASYNIYMPSKKMWLSPFILTDGSYGSESTSQTGTKVVWVGTAHDGPSGKLMSTRDTYANSANKYTDLGENRIGGVWKAIYNITCTKS